MVQQVSSDTLDEIVEIILEKVTARGSDTEEMKGIIDEVVFQLPTFKAYSLAGKAEISTLVFNKMCAYDILQPFLDDEEVTEIMCNGYDMIFIERNGKLEKTSVKFQKLSYYRALLQRIAAEVNRKIDFSTPIVDARLSDGSRVNIVLDPVALNGPILTIRKFGKEVYSLGHLASKGSMTDQWSDYLKEIIYNRKNIFIAGGTGSGKTTLLNALCKEIPEDERIITVEDSAEIIIRDVENVVSLEKRNANMEGSGEISIAELIRTALRMRPDRIIVGEIRGAEAIDMLQAMNTGHAGSISTGHANSPIDMLRRIETMVLSGIEIPVSAIRQQIASAIDVVVYLERSREGIRRIASIQELVGLKGDEYELRNI